MFGLSFTEVVIIAILALVLLGPDQLPQAARTMGKALRDLKRATDDIKDQFEGEVRNLDLNVDLDADGNPRAAEAPPAPIIPAMPVPGQAEPPPEATAENVPGLEAAQAEPAPAEASAAAAPPADEQTQPAPAAPPEPPPAGNA